MRSLVHDLIEEVHAGLPPRPLGRDIPRHPGSGGCGPGVPLESAWPRSTATYEVGDTRLPFCIQSISKPFTYGVALTDRGHEFVDSKIDVEPSGDAFNEISLHPVTHRPRNPMINAGAIAASSLVDGATRAADGARQRGLLGLRRPRFPRWTRRSYASQLESGHRSRAIGHMLREFGILECEPDHAVEGPSAPVLDHGRLPRPEHDGRDAGQRWLAPADRRARDRPQLHRARAQRDVELRHVRRVGRMDRPGGHGGKERGGRRHSRRCCPDSSRSPCSRRASTSTATACAASRPAAGSRTSSSCTHCTWHAALTARSAIPTTSSRPPLRSNGPRRTAACSKSTAARRGSTSCMVTSSSRGRNRSFARSPGPQDDLELVALDVRRINDVAEVSRRLLRSLRAALYEQGCETALIDPDGLVPKAATSNGGQPASQVFQTIAATTTWFEDRMLERHGNGTRSENERFHFAEHPFVEQMAGGAAEELRRRMEPRTYAPGEMIVAQGDAEAGLFLIMSGRVRSLADHHRRHRAHPGHAHARHLLRGALRRDRKPPPAVHARRRTRGGPRADTRGVRRAGDEDPELRAAVLELFIFAVHDDVDRTLRALATGRVTPTTSS